MPSTRMADVTIRARPVPAWVRTIGDWLRWRQQEDEWMAAESVRQLETLLGEEHPELHEQLLEKFRELTWGREQ